MAFMAGEKAPCACAPKGGTGGFARAAIYIPASQKRRPNIPGLMYQTLQGCEAGPMSERAGVGAPAVRA